MKESELTTLMVIVGVVLSLLLWTLSLSTRFALLRVIPLPHLKVRSYNIVLSAVLRSSIVLCLTFAYLSLPKPEDHNSLI